MAVANSADASPSGDNSSGGGGSGSSDSMVNSISTVSEDIRAVEEDMKEVEANIKSVTAQIECVTGVIQGGKDADDQPFPDEYLGMKSKDPQLRDHLSQLMRHWSELMQKEGRLSTDKEQLRKDKERLLEAQKELQHQKQLGANPGVQLLDEVQPFTEFVSSGIKVLKFLEKDRMPQHYFVDSYDAVGFCRKFVAATKTPHWVKPHAVITGLAKLGKSTVLNYVLAAVIREMCPDALIWRYEVGPIGRGGRPVFVLIDEVQRFFTKYDERHDNYSPPSFIFKRLVSPSTMGPPSEVYMAVTGSSMCQAWQGFSSAPPHGHTPSQARYVLTIPVNEDEQGGLSKKCRERADFVIELPEPSTM
ncbi:hypothetical protein JKP88DRAFT_350616 [Tribonema minus]|uniref:Uncharacterized protein n=1 Tax=Tribonema minus TaxID=303371 RepID=A0A835YNJ1_9STRA|nr:hypothetical protein JKP88DRAFT_350616 [Tribonema minus]